MKTTNITGLPSSLVSAIEKNTYDISQDNQKIISVSTLINPPKIRQLTVRHWADISEDVADKIWLLLGSSVHAIMERIDDTGRFIEERMYLDSSTWEIVDKANLDKNVVYIAGKPDLYEASEKAIQDYKITSSWTFVYGGREEWVEQLNCYAFFFKKLGFPVEKLQIIGILKDWSKTKARADATYPQQPIIIQNLELWSEDKQLEFIKNRLTKHLDCVKLLDDDIPVCEPHERWTTQDVWAVMKTGNKRAVKLFTASEEALEYCNKLNENKKNFYIETRNGRNIRCEGYCSVAPFCSFYKTNVKQGESDGVHEEL